MAEHDALDVEECRQLVDELEFLRSKRGNPYLPEILQKRYEHRPLPVPTPPPDVQRNTRVVYHEAGCPRLGQKPGCCSCDGVVIQRPLPAQKQGKRV